MLMLETLENRNNVFFYTAIEDIEDVSHTELGKSEEQSTYYEEDKNYDENHNFTIFSPEIKNTLVSFFDVYVGSWKSSAEVLLGFYTTASFGKERNKFIVDGLEVHPPKDSLLESLSKKSDLSDDCAKMIKSVVLQEYKKQYSSRRIKGNLKTLENMEIDKFIVFLKKINWRFGGEDEEELKVTVLQLIRDSRYYSVHHQSKDEIIFSLLMEALDERQNNPYLTSRVITESDVRYIFLKAQSEESDLSMDPVWQDLKTLETEINDKRNLEEKIISVCPNYNKKKIKHLARLACRSKTEQLSSNKSFMSLKYRIYEACSEYFFNNACELDLESEIDSVIEELKTISICHIEELKKDYSYSISNALTINGIVMDLIDSCFLSFDEVKNEK